MLSEPGVKQEVVTIDGPSGVGKSTISRRVAARLSYTYLDTGAMYRAVGLKFQEEMVDLGDAAAIEQCLRDISIDLHPAATELDDVTVILDGRDVSKAIRTVEVAMLASKVSALYPVREKLTLMQQNIGRKGRIVAEGRDTGTVVFPDASWKFFLDATPEERTRRRAKQLRSQGVDVDEKELLNMIVTRDNDDINRSIAPLCRAEDAVVIDSSNLDIDQVTARILEIIQSAQI